MPMSLLYGHPTNLAALTVLMVGFVTGVVGIVRVSKGQRAEAQQGGRRDGRSVIGISIQMVSFFVATGPAYVTSGLADGITRPRTWIVAALIAVSVWLALSSFRVMGEEWAFVARTRAEHRLITSGPFALVRNPIYLALLLYLVALATATGFELRLLVALPIFAVGTAFRVRAEERLLRATFGVAYDDYAARVKRIFPALL